MSDKKDTPPQNNLFDILSRRYRMDRAHSTTPPAASTSEQADRSSVTDARQISSMFGAPRVTPNPTVTSLINEPPSSTVTSAMNRPFGANFPQLSTPLRLPTAPNTDYQRLYSQNLMQSLGGSTSQGGHSLGHHNPAPSVAPIIKSVTQKNKMHGSSEKKRNQKKPYTRQKPYVYVPPPPMSPTVTDNMNTAIDNVATGANKKKKNTKSKNRQLVDNPGPSTSLGLPARTATMVNLDGDSSSDGFEEPIPLRDTSVHVQGWRNFTPKKTPSSSLSLNRPSSSTATTTSASSSSNGPRRIPTSTITSSDLQNTPSTSSTTITVTDPQNTLTMSTSSSSTKVTHPKNTSEREEDKEHYYAPCWTCEVEGRNCAYIPCGHVTCCYRCASSRSTCPRCLAPATSAFRIYPA